MSLTKPFVVQFKDGRIWKTITKECDWSKPLRFKTRAAAARWVKRTNTVVLVGATRIRKVLNDSRCRL